MKRRRRRRRMEVVSDTITLNSQLTYMMIQQVSDLVKFFSKTCCFSLYLFL